MNKKIRLNRSEVGRVLKGPEMRAYLERIGRELADEADYAAPIGETGELSQSHYHEVEEIKDRVVVRVKSDLPYAATVAANTGYFTEALDGVDVE